MKTLILQIEKLQRHPNHPVRLIRQKEGDIQHVPIQLQVVQEEADAKLDLAWEQLLEFSEAAAGGVGFGFDLHGGKCRSRAG